MGCGSSKVEDLQEKDNLNEKKPSSASRRSSTSSTKSDTSLKSSKNEETEEDNKKRKRLEDEKEKAGKELEKLRGGNKSAIAMGVTNSSMQDGRSGTASGNKGSKEIALDRETLEAYLRVEKEIAVAELNNPLQPMDLKAEQLARLTEEVNQKEHELKELQSLTEKEKADVEKLKAGITDESKDVKSTFMEMNFDEQLSKEQAEYMAALNKQEMKEQELESAKKQKEQVQQELKELEKSAEHLQELYKRQDTLLDRMFGGGYGSLLENKLEDELDTLESHRGRILEANFKWRQAQMMLEYACKQLAVAVQKWQDLPTLPTIDLEVRYSVAAETRNNLVAANQNLKGAHKYLDNVQFPYCDPNEVATLNKATEYVFTDMQSTDRHSHAHACYATSHKRANALLQWFDTVINSTIMRDLSEISDKVKDKTLELRQERVRLIQSKIREMWGTDVDLETTLRDDDVNIEKMAKAMMNSNAVVKVEGGELESDRASTPPPLNDSELAPVPSNSIIFGKSYDNYQDQLDRIAKQHQEDLQNFIKDQESKNQKIRGSLEEKLALRRRRRAQQNLEQAQKNALAAK